MLSRTEKLLSMVENKMALANDNGNISPGVTAARLPAVVPTVIAEMPPAEGAVVYCDRAT